MTERIANTQSGKRLSRADKGPLRRIVNNVFTGSQIDKIKRAIATFVPGGNLHLDAYLYGSDKWGYHNYIEHYARHFAQLRKRRLNLLEIGVGGYEEPTSGGESLRMWKKYFPRASVYGIDIHDKSPLNEARIKTFKGSQNDPGFLKWVANQIGKIDIVIDDGSHINEHIVTSFHTLFPLLEPGGLYVIEDLQTSYWSNYGGSSTDLSMAGTAMSMLKALTDGLNFQEFTIEGYQPTVFDQTVVGLHFYHNIAFVEKGLNDDAAGTLGRPVNS